MLKKLEELFDELFSARQSIPAGMVQYQAPADSDLPYKLHLRVEEDGSGILIINASTVLHLNQTAAELAYYLIQGKTDEKIIALISERYDVDAGQASDDLADFTGRIDSLLQMEDLDPVTYLNMDRVSPYSQKLSAPYRMDCALTYQVRETVDAGVAPVERVSRELSTEEWEQILENIHNASIPQVVFTGGEPTLRDDLPELIAKAEELGIVCGLLTDGLSLTTKKAVDAVLNKGLDHIMLLTDAHNKKFWSAVNRLVPEDIAVTVHFTLTAENAGSFKKTLDKLSKAGVTHLSLSTNDENLADALEDANQHAVDLGMALVWDLPVPYSGSNPVAFELGKNKHAHPDGAGKAWMYVEPDGDVLPAQGINKVLGNILKDPWKKIWKKRGA